MIFLAGFGLGAAVVAAAAYRLRLRKRAELGRYLSFAAHELNTPVTAINMTVLNLASGVFGDVPKDQLQWLEMTREQLGRLNGMVGELRDFVHLVLQRDLLVRLEDLQPAEAVAAAVRAVKTGSEHAKIELVSSAPEGLPAVRADVDRLTRSLTTLLFHARKFRSSGPIRISAREENGGVAFDVAFTGARLDPDEAARSLEVLYPARPRGQNRGMTATGLGLGLVRELARRQGGDLELRASADGEQVLTLRVPARVKVVK